MAEEHHGRRCESAADRRHRDRLSVARQLQHAQMQSIVVGAVQASATGAAHMAACEIVHNVKEKLSYIALEMKTATESLNKGKGKRQGQGGAAQQGQRQGLRQEGRDQDSFRVRPPRWYVQGC